ncbi:MAG: cell wall-binding repeat-containing protein [Actinomycetota bacterium]|jgi:putative cell wall-binding protein|nr:cell wall-binding repeat-containing protein [Actinomycetota bacterium]
MRRVLSVLLSTVLVLPALLIAPPGAVAVTAPGLKVAVVRSTVAYGTRSYLNGAYLNGGNGTNAQYDSRVDAVIQVLTDSKEFSSVTKIGDTELSSLSLMKNYDVVVFPRTLALTNIERDTMLAYVAEGGGVVGTFGLSRWAYDSSYAYGYKPFLGQNAANPGLYTWQPSSDALKPWEWGQISELYNVKFKNDDIMGGGYKLQGKPLGDHWILSQTAADVGVSSISMTAKVSDYNETVYSMNGAGNLTPLLTYSTLGNTETRDDVDNGLMAGWTSEYYFGRFVYYGFQLHDLCRELEYYSDVPTRNQAQRLLVNSVRWAGDSSEMAYVNKAPVLTAKGWFTRGQLWVNESVVNGGNISLRGALNVDVYNPAGARVYSGQAYNNLCPLPPGGEYVHASWQPTIGTSHMSGTWTVKMSYQYYDYFRGGTVTAVRNMYMYSTGTSMIQGGYGEQTVIGGSLSPATSHEQIAGTSRYDTGIELSKKGWPNGISSERAVILATGANYPDALAAAPLAGKLDAPVLLVPPTGLTSTLVTELQRLYAGMTEANIYVVGGEVAVSSATVAQAESTLRAMGVAELNVTRLAGSSRWGTARAIAEEVGAPVDGAFADTAFIVSGENYPDALAASPLAAKMGVPILLVQKNAIPGDTTAALVEMGIEHTILVGGTGVVSTVVEGQLEAAGFRVAGISDNNMRSVDTRLHGTSRFDTGLRCVEYSLAMGAFTESDIYIATGRNWPDALALAPVAGKNSRPLVLLDGSDIKYSASVANYLHSMIDSPPGVSFVGGSGAVEDVVRGQVRVALGL